MSSVRALAHKKPLSRATDMSTLALLLLNLLAQSDPGENTSAAVRYEAILATHNRQAKERRLTAKELELAHADRKQQLGDFVDSYANRRKDNLKLEDSISLCKAAAELRRHVEVVQFAYAGLSSHADIGLYVFLVRSLYAGDQFKEAERAIEQASVRCGEQPGLHELHGLAASAYLRNKQFDKAYTHQCCEIRLCIKWLDKSSFFSSRISRCLESVDDLYDRSPQAATTIQDYLTEWRGALADEFNRRIGRPCEDRVEGDLTKLRWNTTSLIEVQRRIRESEIESIVTPWLSFLDQQGSIKSSEEEWLRETAAACFSVRRFLLPAVDGKAAESRLIQIYITNLDVPSHSNRHSQLKLNTLANVKETIGIIRQHRRHTIQAKTGIELRGLVQEVKPAQNFRLVCIVPATGKVITDMTNSLLINRTKLDVASVGVQVMSVNDVAGDKANKQPDMTAQRHGDKPSFSATFPIHSLERDSKLHEVLRPMYFPVLVLLDDQQHVEAVVTGSEPLKVHALIKLVKR